jgi:sterol carrier protein 2
MSLRAQGFREISRVYNAALHRCVSIEELILFAKILTSSPQTGAAAVVLISETFLASHSYLKKQAIQIAGQSLATDTPALFETKSAIELIGSDMTRQAAKAAYKQAAISPRDVSVVELHDCFTTNEMCALEGLGLAKEGEAWKLVRDGGLTYGPDGGVGASGKGWIVNPSGGLISKGHPLGATGLAQCAELGEFRSVRVISVVHTSADICQVWHLRGWAKSRAVKGTKFALQHNMGLGGATVVTIYKRPDGGEAPKLEDTRPETDGRNRLGYNPAEEARSITRSDWESVTSHPEGVSEWATAELPWNKDPRAYEARAKL